MESLDVFEIYEGNVSSVSFDYLGYVGKQTFTSFPHQQKVNKFGWLKIVRCCRHFSEKLYYSCGIIWQRRAFEEKKAFLFFLQKWNEQGREKGRIGNSRDR